MKTLVYSENIEHELQLLGKGLEHGEASVITSSRENCNNLIKSGAKRAYLIKGRSVCLIKNGIIEAIKIEDPNLVLFGSTKREKELASRISVTVKSRLLPRLLRS